MPLRSCVLLSLLVVACGSSSGGSSPGPGGPGGGGGPIWAHAFADDYAKSPNAESPVGPLLVGANVAARPSGGALVAATLFGPTDAGAGAIGADGTSTAFFAALGADGKPSGVAGALQIGPDADGKPGEILSVEVASDSQSNVILAGGFSGTLTLGNDKYVVPSSVLGIFVAKLDASGKLLWSKASKTAAQSYVGGLAVDASDDIWVDGWMWSGTVDFGGGPAPATAAANGVYVAKLDPSGNALFTKGWAVTSPSVTPSFGAIGVDAKGDGVLRAELTGSVDLDGHPIMAGKTRTVAVVRVDGSGAVQDAKTLTSASVSLDAFAVDPAGDVVVGGSCFGATFTLGTSQGACKGGFVAKLSPSLDVTWVRPLSVPDQAGFGGTTTSGQIVVQALAVGPGGAVAFGGWYVGDADVGGGPMHWTAGNTGLDGSPGGGGGPTPDAFVAALDANGNLSFADGFGDGSLQSTTGVAFDAAGRVIATGWFGGSIDLGAAGKLSSQKEDDVFVAAFGR